MTGASIIRTAKQMGANAFDGRKAGGFILVLVPDPKSPGMAGLAGTAELIDGQWVWANDDAVTVGNMKDLITKCKEEMS